MNIIQYTIIYGLVYTLVLLILMRKYEGKTLTSTQRTKLSSKHTVVLAIIIGLVILIVPVVLYVISNYHSFPNPDTYFYIVSSYIDNWSTMPIDKYYKSFPIYVILMKSLGLITGIEPALAIMAIHLSALCLLFIGIVILLGYLGRKTHIASHTIFLIPFIFISSIYLYLYFNIMIPQTFSLWIIIFLFIILLSSKRNILLVVLLSILGLVHGLTIPFLSIVLLVSFVLGWIISKVYINGKNATPFLENKSMLLSTVILIIIYSLYAIYAYRVAGLEAYMYHYIDILYRILYQPEGFVSIFIGIAPYGGITRQYPFISALGPAFIVAVFILGLYLIIFKRLLPHPLILGMMICGVIFLSIGLTRYYIAIDIPSGSVARYVNVYGFLFLVIYDIYVIHQITMRYSNKVMYFVIIGMALIGMTGSLFDPLTIPYKPTHSNVLFARTLSSLIEPYSTIYFESVELRYYLGPQIFFWKFQDKAININPVYIKDVLIIRDVPPFSYDVIIDNMIFAMEFNVVYIHGSLETNPILIIRFNPSR